MSKNRKDVAHIKIACRHYLELREAGVTENHAIRTVEFFVDFYAKLSNGGRPGPNHVRRVPAENWSLAALKLRSDVSDAKPRDHFRVEHGTPKRAFARMVLERYERDELDEAVMNDLVNRHYKLAVITLEEDARLNRLARSVAYETPNARWAACDIVFQCEPAQSSSSSAQIGRAP